MNAATDAVWMIWSNEHEQWWRANSRGYTSNGSQAGRYCLIEALQIVTGAGRNGSDVPNEFIVISPELVESLLGVPAMVVPPEQEEAIASADHENRTRQDCKEWSAGYEQD